MEPPPSPTAYRVDWLSGADVAGPGALGVCGLPGIKRGPMEARSGRDMVGDLDALVAAGVSDVMLLVTDDELRRHKATAVASEMQRRGVRLRRVPITAGEAPPDEQLHELVMLLHTLLREGKHAVLACRTGLGRACTVAALYLQEAQPGLSGEAAVERVRALRGPAAIQTVRQWNAVTGYTPRVLPR